MFIKGMWDRATFGREDGGGSGTVVDDISNLIDEQDGIESGDDDAGDDTSAGGNAADGQQQDDARQDQDNQRRDQQLSTDRRVDPKNRPDQQRQIKDRQDTGPAKPGDLVNAQGQVLARAGVERRMYERAVGNLKPQFERVQGAARQFRDQLATATAELNALKQANESLRSIGMSPQDLSQAAQLWNTLKTKPKEALTALVAQAKSRGIALDGVGPSGIDMTAITAMLDNKLKPILDAHGQQQETVEARRSAAQAAQQFLNAHPDAAIHEQYIAATMRDAETNHGVTLTPREAYLQVRLFAQTHGLDWNQPLAPQIRARQGVNGNGNARTEQRPRFNGRPQFDGQADDVNNVQQADVDEPWDSIVRREMRAAGINVRR